MTVTRAWMLLIVLSAGSTLASLAPQGVALVGAVMVLAAVKADLIVNHYLGLAQAPAFARGFRLVLTVFVLLLAGLALAA